MMGMPLGPLELALPLATFLWVFDPDSRPQSSPRSYPRTLEIPRKKPPSERGLCAKKREIYAS